MSAEAADLLSRLMDKDVESRITAAEALKHPWIVEGAPVRVSGCAVSWRLVVLCRAVKVGSGAKVKRRPPPTLWPVLHSSQYAARAQSWQALLGPMLPMSPL